MACTTFAFTALPSALYAWGSLSEVAIFVEALQLRAFLWRHVPAASGQIGSAIGTWVWVKAIKLGASAA